jgi:hypothetical protein
MNVTTHKLNILAANAKYYLTTARQLQRLCLPRDRDGRITRGHLSDLHHAGLIQKTRMQVVNPLHAVTAPCYYPSPEGVKYLALHTGNVEYLQTPTQNPAWQNLGHWVQLTELHMTVDTAVSLQTAVTLTGWFNEFDVVNKEAVNPAERYRLYTLLSTSPKKLCCIPDAAFSLSDGKYTKAYYLELETGSNDPGKAAAEKSPGYAALAAQFLHRRHFPAALDRFAVLVFAPHAAWRDALRRTFGRKESAHLYRFAALTEVTAEAFLTKPIFWPCDGEPVPLVKGGAP